ncbi:MAG: deoxyribodipyrimidine photo-lyase [Candidatus Roizmanbacteria bacterium]
MKTRIKSLNNQLDVAGKCVLYIMSRDQRTQDNFALLSAQQYAIERKVALIVCFIFHPQVKNRLHQQYEYILEGLKQVEITLLDKDIPFIIESGNPIKEIPLLVSQLQPSALFFDFSPLREARDTQQSVVDLVQIPVFVVDTHNIIPIWVASEKEEFAGYTLRSKIQKLLPTYLVSPPELIKHPFSYIKYFKNDWSKMKKTIRAPRPSFYIPSFIPGESSVLHELNTFIKDKFLNYSDLRNDPSFACQSNMSPYLNFGHISSLRIALIIEEYVNKHKNNTKLYSSFEAYLEELIVRKELADNYCYYNTNYDSYEGLRDWAKITLEKHIDDIRINAYSLRQLEYAQTVDPAWNASQLQLLNTGKIHGYMRMYWAKKLLEWAPSPQQAIENAIYLNDTYQLDGHNPNGYVGILWSIGGLHDRPWFERSIFGQIRYMNYNGLKNKFNISEYIDRWITQKVHRI